MNGMALCAGAGGLELGLHLALGDAYRTVVGVEWEASAAAVLVARQQDSSFPPFPVWDSVATFDGRPWRGVVDIVSGGFPCQPFSVAGKRGGDSDSRHLWPHIARIVEESQPGIVFLENVPGLLTTPLAGGSGFAYELVESDLLRLGYRVACGLFTAAEVGAPHQRERLFILAHAGSAGADGWTAFEDGERWQGAPGDDCGTGRALADSQDDYGRRREWREESGTRPDGERRRGLASSGSDVADTALGGQRERGESSGGERQPDGSDERLADPGDGQLSQPGRGAEGRSRPFANSAHELPAFPPGPSGRDAWSQILRDHPDLAPALSRWDVLTNALRSRGLVPPQHSGKNRRARRLEEQKTVARARGRADDGEEPLVHPAHLPAATQSELRRVAHELATDVDLPRAARLRLTGNGVVPACAALAFRTLWGQLADAGHPERTGGVCDEG